MMVIKTLQSMNKNDNNTAVKVISQNNNTAVFSQICILTITKILQLSVK